MPTVSVRPRLSPPASVLCQSPNQARCAYRNGDWTFGPAPSAIVEWSGARLGATGGAQSATCTSGSFGAGPTQALIADWPSSGTITCRIALTLVNPRVLTPGFYNASIDLELRDE